MRLDPQATDTSGLRTALVGRLVSAGVLTDPRLRAALLRVRREVLLPHAYVRVSDPGADPVDWRLLDGSHPEDREEWLALIHGDESILLQRDGEPLDSLARGPVTGGHMTSMSSYTPATVEALQVLGLAPGLRYLELGTGPGRRWCPRHAEGHPFDRGNSHAGPGGRRSSRLEPVRPVTDVCLIRSC
ncbi:hypothetical protein ACWC4J_11050 [Streptomyces sp. NPDC001356]